MKRYWHGGEKRGREGEGEGKKVVTNPIRCAGAAEEPLFSNTKTEGSRATSQKVTDRRTQTPAMARYCRIWKMNENSEKKKICRCSTQGAI